MGKKITAVMLVLLSMLTLTSCIFGKYTYNSGGSYNEYTERTVITEDVKNIDISWVSGKVHILKGAELAIEERGGKGDYLPLYYKVDDGTLFIKYAKNGTDSQYLADNTKEVLITVPGDLESLHVDAVAADYDIDIGSVNEIDINSVSGKGNVVTELCADADIESVSGFVKMAVRHSHDLESLTIKTTSADAELYFDGIRSFKTVFNSNTGGYSTEIREGTDNTYTPFDISFESVSGSLFVRSLN